MVNRKLLLSGIFFSILILSIGNIIAFSCSLTQTCTTTNPGEGVLMSLSEEDNAHGEVRDGGGNYPWKICCDFEGTKKCDGKNGVLSLSESTNGHAEILGTGNYINDVCFGAVECRSGSDITCLDDEFGVVSLSDVTNAHLGAFDKYSQKVCCKWTANAYFADPDDYNVKKSVVSIGDRVALVLNNSGLTLGAYQGFEVFEHDSNFDDEILAQDNDRIVGDVFSSGSNSILLGVWEVTAEDYDAGKDLLLESSPDEFYFVVNGVTSSYLNIVARDEGASFCADFTSENLCSSCSNHVDCTAAYNSADDISKETFSVGCGEALLDDANYKTNCFCEWDSTSDSCGAGVSYISANSKTIQPHCKNDVQDEDEVGIDCEGADCGVCVDGEAVAHCKNNVQDEDEAGLDCGGTECGDCSYTASFPKIGSCSYISQGEDDCDDNFLEYTWEGDWNWGVNNGFPSTEQEFSNDPTDYVEENGLFYYDPLGMSQNCQGGTNVIPCPAQVQLPFFGFLGIIFSLIFISLIYVYLIFKNKKNF